MDTKTSCSPAGRLLRMSIERFANPLAETIPRQGSTVFAAGRLDWVPGLRTQPSRPSRPQSWKAPAPCHRLELVVRSLVDVDWRDQPFEFDRKREILGEARVASSGKAGPVFERIAGNVIHGEIEASA